MRRALINLKILFIAQSIESIEKAGVVTMQAGHAKPTPKKDVEVLMAIFITTHTKFPVSQYLET